MHHCTKCVRQFKSLKTETDDEGDEQYDVCPHCGNDMFLGSGELPIELLKKIVKKPLIKSIKKNKIFKSLEEWEYDEMQRNKREDMAINNYFQRVGNNDVNAEKLFFKELKTN